MSAAERPQDASGPVTPGQPGSSLSEAHTAAEGMPGRERELVRRALAERIAEDVIGQIDMGQGIPRTAVNFADGIRSGWLNASTISHVVTMAALQGLKEADQIPAANTDNEGMNEHA